MKSYPKIIDRILDAIRASRTFCVVGHLRPDGDCVGSQLGLTLALLTQHRVRIQRLMARAVVLKYTPRLRFAVDDSVVRGNKVLQIIEELEKSAPAESDSNAPNEELSENH